MTESFYEVLGVSPDASTAAIQAAYRDRLKETHPDVSNADDASEQTQLLIEARDVLTDADERARYDRLGHEAYVSRTDEWPTDDDVSDVAAAARRAGYGDSTAAGSAGEATDHSPDGPGTDGEGADPDESASGRERARRRANRERRARERVRQDRTQRAQEPSDGSSAETDDPKPGADAGGSWSAGTASTGGFDDGTAHGTRHTWRSASTYTVRQESDVTGKPLLEMPTGRSLTLFAIVFVLYPVMLFSTLLPAFPLWVNLTIGFCTVLLIGYLQSEPTIAIMVFGSWSITTPILLLTLDISAFSLVGLLALSGSWLPFGLSLLTLSVLRL